MDQARAQSDALAPDASQTQRPRTHRLDDAPLRSKVALMVVAGVMVGIGVDLAADYLGTVTILGREIPSTLFGVVGFMLSASVLILLGQWWIATPYDRLVRQIDKVADRRQMDDLSSLPLTRRDEAGRIARAMHRVTTVAIRDGRDIRQLRKTLDVRVRTETQRATAELKRMALRDPLTDLGNRRFLEHQLAPIVDVTREADAELCALAIDLDGFKQVNDTRGHDTGDELLVLLAGLLKACTRHDDLCIRVGGDEFVVLMPGCDTARAVAVADSIRALYRQQAGATLRQGPYTDLSVGVAALQHDRCRDGELLLKLADQRLYAAKRAGKGRTCAD